jgi:hypothetical protein
MLLSGLLFESRTNILRTCSCPAANMCLCADRQQRLRAIGTVTFTPTHHSCAPQATIQHSL